MGARTSGAGRWLFWTLATISLVWTIGQLALRRAEIGEFLGEFLSFTLMTGFFWWLLTNGPTFALQIIDSMQQIAGNASGLGSTVYPSTSWWILVLNCSIGS